MIARTGLLLLLTCLLLTASVARAADTGRLTFSGTVAGLDPQEGVLLVDEVGPWTPGRGRSATTRRTVFFTDRTKFNTFIRVTVPGSFAGDFLEVELQAEDVTPGDFATVECVRERGRLVAVRVTLAESHPGDNVMTQ